MPTIVQFGLLLCISAFYADATSPSRDKRAKSKCIPEFGCFETRGDFFSLKYRPISVPPRDREEINTQFTLYTRQNPKNEDILVAGKKRQSHFDPTRQTKFIVHGWIDQVGFADWMKELKDEFLLHGDYNVILTDWSGGNKLPYYQATANSRVVGAEIAHLIKYLNTTYGLKPEQCHVIGHSLGAHVAGYAGERLKTLGRITGLDPAEPYFQEMPPSVRIDETDAQFVDVIHSDAKSILLAGLGMSQLVGHVDFFPNNGRDHPGCTKEKFRSFLDRGFMEGVRRYVACNHMRAVDFFIESINHNQCTPVGYACKDWKTFVDGQCTSCGSDGSKCAVMGIGAEQYRNISHGRKESLKAYLLTSSKPHLCAYHYHVTVRLANLAKTRDERGELSVTLSGDRGSEEFKLSSKVEDLYHGNSYSYLVTTTKNLGELNEYLSINWKHKSTIFNPKTWNLFKKPRLYISSVVVQPLNAVDVIERAILRLKTCPNDNLELFSDKPETIKKCV